MIWFIVVSVIFLLEQNVEGQCDANIATIAPAAQLTMTNTDYFVQTSKGVNTGNTAVTFSGSLDVFSALSTRNWLSPLATGIAFPGQPTGNAQVRLISTSAADAAAGTGCQTVRIDGYNAAGAAISETLTMNGLTVTVASTVATYSFVNQLVCLTVGSGLRNAGIISVNTLGPTPIARNPVIGLPSGVGSSAGTTGWYRVPLAQSFIFTAISVDVFRSGTAVTTLDATVFVFYQLTATSPAILFDRISATADGTASVHKEYKTSVVLPAGTLIWLEGIQTVVLGQFLVKVSGVLY